MRARPTAAGIRPELRGGMPLGVRPCGAGSFAGAALDHKPINAPIGKDAVDHTEVEIESPNSHPSARRVAPPVGGPFARLYEGADLADSYAICLPASASRDSLNMARLLFERPSIWFRALMVLRNLIVVWFGIQSFRRLRQPSGVRRIIHIGCFHIYSYSPNNIVIGRDDKHLNLRIAVLLRKTCDDAMEEMVVTTVMHCHNSFGRGYVKAILPFYRLAVRSNLHHAAASEQKERNYFSQEHSSWLTRIVRAIEEWAEDRNIFIPRYRSGGSTCIACGDNDSQPVDRTKDRLDDELFYPPFREIYPRIQDESRP